VVPHWIGLDRARREFEQLTDQEKQDSGGLVDPDLVADTVATLAPRRSIGGPHCHHPCGPGAYDVDRESADPHEQPES
jgi:hypothetical protein